MARMSSEVEGSGKGDTYLTFGGRTFIGIAKEFFHGGRAIFGWHYTFIWVMEYSWLLRWVYLDINTPMTMTDKAR